MSESDTRDKYVVFQLRQASFGLPLECVCEVLRMLEITALPEAPAWLAGVINFRGQVIPVLDLRLRLGLVALPYELNTPIMVVLTAGRRVGLIADDMQDVFDFPPASLTPPDALASLAHPVQALARQDDRLVILLDLALLTTGLEDLDLKNFDPEVYFDIDPRD